MASCTICYTPLIQPRTGRRRVTCSQACRQKLYRKRQIRFIERIEAGRAERRADREIARLERQFGAFDDNRPSQYAPSLRERILFRLRRGIPLLRCKKCEKPFIRDMVGSTRYCSKGCARKYRKRYKAVREAMYVKRLGLKIKPEAYEALRKQTPLKFCLHCGIPFAPHSGPGRPAVYCSTACRQAGHWTRHHGRVVAWKKCAECGKAYPAKHKCQKYCGVQCKRRRRDRARYIRHHGMKTHFWGVCIVCGVKLPAPAKTGGWKRQTCSQKCRDRGTRMRAKQRREQGLGRQGRRCEWCGTALGWQAHGH